MIEDGDNERIANNELEKLKLDLPKLKCVNSNVAPLKF